MEEVERMNAVLIRKPEQGLGASLRRDPYTMEVDRGRDCYTCRGFGHIAYYCRNQRRERVAKKRRLKYERRREGLYEYGNHLKEKENLETLS